MTNDEIRMTKEPVAPEAYEKEQESGFVKMVKGVKW